MTRLGIHPWRSGNSFRIMTEAESFYAAMLEAIDSAREEILFEMYLVESGRVVNRFLKALGQAAQRGVTIRMLLDDFGARGLSAIDRLRIENAGIELAFYNPLARHKWRLNLRRDHRKLLLIDRQLGFTGGAALSDQLLTVSPSRGWRETMLEMSGPVLNDWASLFNYTWNKYSRKRADTLPTAQVDTSGEMRGRVVQSRGAHRPGILRSFLQRTHFANTRIWISTPYFIPSHRLRRSLRSAARRGCDVRLLVPGRFIDHPGVRFAGRRYYGKLLRTGVRIFEYRPCFLHSKVLLCDEWASIGSSNLDLWNQFWNLDANQEIDDRTFCARVESMLVSDFGHAREIDAEQWRKRPWHRRVLERWWGFIEKWLFRVTGRGLSRHRRRGRKRKSNV